MHQSSEAHFELQEDPHFWTNHNVQVSDWSQLSVSYGWCQVLELHIDAILSVYTTLSC
jgi:hypothetical protein